MGDRDAAEAAARRDAHARNVGLVSQVALPLHTPLLLTPPSSSHLSSSTSQVAAWIDSAEPLVEWGCSERHPSCWLAFDGGTARDKQMSLGWAQLTSEPLRSGTRAPSSHQPPSSLLHNQRPLHTSPS
jgi:hypothetical protein